MELRGNFMFLERFEGKGNRDYLSGVDVDTGGTIRLSIPREMVITMKHESRLACHVRGRTFEGKDGAPPSFSLSVVPAPEPEHVEAKRGG
jgi:hypothetical protein